MAYNLYQSVCNLGCEYLQLLSAKTIHSVRSLHPLYPGPPKPNGLNPVRCYETQKKHCAKGNEPKYTHICISGWIKSISLTWTQLLSYGQLWGWFPLWTMHANMCTYIYIYIQYTHNIHKYIYIYIPIRCSSPSQIPILDGSLVLNPIFISILWI